MVHRAALAHNVGYSPEDLSSDHKLDALFRRWMTRRHKVYNGVEEKTKRFKAFKDNLKYIHERNKEIKGYWLGFNEFADLTHEEFNARYLGLKDVSPKRSLSREFRYGNVSNLPESVDWRARGAVTPAKSQGGCESCWAFSAVATVEGINQIATGKLLNLSEQELIDCDKDYNIGCEGGIMDPAFKFIAANGGVHKEEDYLYLARDGPCQKKEVLLGEGDLLGIYGSFIRRMSNVDVDNPFDTDLLQQGGVATISGFEDVPHNDERSLLQALAHQPVSIGADASARDFGLYKGGVFDWACGTNLNHGVTAVGYGSAERKDYIVVKNSWGPTWGEEGFIRIKRKDGDPMGLCGIYGNPSYPSYPNKA